MESFIYVNIHIYMNIYYTFVYSYVQIFIDVCTIVFDPGRRLLWVAGRKHFAYGRPVEAETVEIYDFVSWN